MHSRAPSQLEQGPSQSTCCGLMTGLGKRPAIGLYIGTLVRFKKRSTLQKKPVVDRFG